MKRKLLCITLAVLLILSLTPAANAIQVSEVNILRGVCIDADVVVSCKVVKITMPAQQHDQTDDYKPYYAVAECKVQKQYFGKTEKTIFVNFPLAETDQFVFQPLPFIKNDTLLMFLAKSEDGSSAKYSWVDCYKISSGSLRNLEYLSRSDYEKSRLSVLVSNIKSVQKQISKIKVNGKKPTDAQLKDIHLLDNLLTYTNGGAVACVKIISTTEEFNSSIITDNELTILELETITPLMGNLPKNFKATGLSGYDMREGKSYVFFFSESGDVIVEYYPTRNIFNVWFNKMEYKDGKVTMPNGYSIETATLDYFKLLLNACPRYKAS